MRVRQRAQFALAERGEGAADVLAKVATETPRPLARLHAIWGLGQVGRRHPSVLRPAIGLLNDADPRVRGQAAKVLGEAHQVGAAGGLIGLLDDPDAHVRFHAAMALGKLRHAPAIGPLFDLVRGDSGRDPFLRHAAVMALLAIGDLDALERGRRTRAPPSGWPCCSSGAAWATRGSPDSSTTPTTPS